MIHKDADAYGIALHIFPTYGNILTNHPTEVLYLGFLICTQFLPSNLFIYDLIQMFGVPFLMFLQGLLFSGPRGKLLGMLGGLAARELEFSSSEEIQGRTSSVERGEW